MNKASLEALVLCILRFTSPYNDIEKRPTPTTLNLKKNSTTLNVPPTVANPLIIASLISIRQKCSVCNSQHSFN